MTIHAHPYRCPDGAVVFPPTRGATVMAYIMKRRRERRRPDRRLEFAELEPRMLLAAVFIPPADRSDGNLIEPPVIESVNGVLKADVNVVQAGYESGNSPSVLY